MFNRCFTSDAFNWAPAGFRVRFTTGGAAYFITNHNLHPKLTLSMGDEQRFRSGWTPASPAMDAAKAPGLKRYWPVAVGRANGGLRN